MDASQKGLAACFFLPVPAGHARNCRRANPEDPGRRDGFAAGFSRSVPVLPAAISSSVFAHSHLIPGFGCGKSLFIRIDTPVLPAETSNHEPHEKHEKYLSIMYAPSFKVGRGYRSAARAGVGCGQAASSLAATCNCIRRIACSRMPYCLNHFSMLYSP